MARLVTPLTDNKCNTAKPTNKDYKLFDGGGLFLLVQKSNIKIWRFNYKRPDQRSNTISFGQYPIVSLKEAREKREEAKKLLSQGIDPQEEKEKLKALLENGNTFQTIALKWTREHAEERKLATDTTNSRIQRLTDYAFPLIGNRVISTLKLQDFIEVINNTKRKAGKHIPKLIRGDLVNIMRYAILNGLIDTNPATDLVGLKLSVKVNHHPALPYNRLKEFIDKVDTLPPINRLTVLINLYVFIRSSELRYARWNEIDFKYKTWTIPESREAREDIRYSDRGGKKRSYIVPLTDKVITLLNELKKYTGHHEFIFVVTGIKPVANMFINHQLQGLGYDTRKDVCGHGFRTMACSALVEAGFSKDAVEKQMSHEEENKVRASYTHLAEFLNERRQLMQWWSDYIDYSQQNGYIAPFDFKKQQIAPIYYFAKPPFIKAS